MVKLHVPRQDGVNLLFKLNVVFKFHYDVTVTRIPYRLICFISCLSSHECYPWSGAANTRPGKANIATIGFAIVAHRAIPGYQVSSKKVRPRRFLHPKDL